MIRILGLSVCVLGACAHESRRPTHEPDLPVSQNSPPAPPKSPYVIADLDGARGAVVAALPLGAPGIHGLVVGEHRFVVGVARELREPRSAIDTTPSPLVGASRIPGRFGGGFLFWTATALYRADAFDSVLVPLARIPSPLIGAVPADRIESVSFAPKAVVVHAKSGGRWGFGLPSGERVPMGPPEMTDVVSLDDGRAMAWSDQGLAFTSTDHGAHWTDVTVQLKSAPTKVATVGSDVWLFDSSSAAARLETDGRLSWFDAPEEVPPIELRPRDPRWRGTESPLRAVFMAGAAIDDTTAIVANDGEIVRVDLRSGRLLSVVPGQFPPDADCEAVVLPGDVVFACVSPGGSAFVVARSSSSDVPAVEQTFAVGGRFVAGDDGGLAYTGSCHEGPAPADMTRVCVRLPGGGWEDRDLSRVVVDGGAPDIRVARWIPRLDGRVVALLVGTPAGIFDPSAQTLVPFDQDTAELLVRGEAPYRQFHVKRGRIIRSSRLISNVVDTTWSFTTGETLRGWRHEGGSVELSQDGKLTPSTYSFKVAHAGAMALGWSKDARLYQSSDHGASWGEVSPPPGGAEAFESVRCTSAGCDLGAFYRIGWPAAPPVRAAEHTPAAPAPGLRHVRGLELACRARGGVVSKALPRTTSSPEDLGLGATRLPVANERSEWTYLRNFIPRAVVSPVRAFEGDEVGETSPRALFSGFGTSDGGASISVNGPNKSAMSLRRDVAYVAPFDPLGRVIRTSLAMSDVVAAGRRAGMSTEELLAADLTETGVIFPLTSADPLGPSEIGVHNSEHGVLAIVHGERTRVVVRPSASSASVVSGVVLGGPADESAFLELEGTGVGRVFKVGGGVVSDLFEINSAATDTSYPTNPDALAVGPKGELAILRTPSGSEPASALDPAFAFTPGAAPSVLAPWSEVKLSDDPACKADPSGYRAVVPLAAPWVRVTSPDLRVEEVPMIARVRWSQQRVCLEGFEVELPSVTVRVPSTAGASETTTVATWLVGRGSTFARVGVAEGIEWRQALDCSVVSGPP